MKRKVILLPVVLLCMVVFFSCESEVDSGPGISQIWDGTGTITSSSNTAFVATGSDGVTFTCYDDGTYTCKADSDDKTVRGTWTFVSNTFTAHGTREGTEKNGGISFNYVYTQNVTGTVSGTTMAGTISISIDITAPATSYSTTVTANGTLALVGEVTESGGGGSGTGTEDPGETSFISWIGSANGQYVVDASGDYVRFSSEGYMYIGTIKITNCYVSGYNVYWNGSSIGVVAGVLSTSNNCIAALVNDNTTSSMIDIYGSNPYYWKYSTYYYCGCDGGCGGDYAWDLGPLEQNP